jgi:hypothetical protein
LAAIVLTTKTTKIGVKGLHLMRKGQWWWFLAFIFLEKVD